MQQLLDTQNTIVPARQEWETPRLIDLSATHTESGSPAQVETITTIDFVAVGPKSGS